MSHEHIELEVENNILTLRGEKSEERREDEAGAKVHLFERSYGSFQRSFTLPRTVRADQISADFEKGILTVRMPKSAEAKSRRISIGTPAESA